VQEYGTNPTANLLTDGVDERFMRTSATESDSYLTDALGSTVELTDATGATEEQYSYSPYGSQSATRMTTSNSYTYTGREFDGLGVDYYRARYYNPATGRFLSEDPIGFAGGMNLYAYAKNNPLKFNDPLGTCANPQGLPADDPLFSDACNSALMLLMLSAVVAFFYISMAIIFLPMILGAWFAEFAELEALETLFALVSHAADTPRMLLIYLLLFPIAPILGFGWAYNNVMNSCGGT
jgi:RHS repeat-associated protein